MFPHTSPYFFFGQERKKKKLTSRSSGCLSWPDFHTVYLVSALPSTFHRRPPMVHPIDRKSIERKKKKKKKVAVCFVTPRPSFRRTLYNSLWYEWRRSINTRHTAGLSGDFSLLFLCWVGVVVGLFWLIDFDCYLLNKSCWLDTVRIIENRNPSSFCFSVVRFVFCPTFIFSTIEKKRGPTTSVFWWCPVSRKENRTRWYTIQEDRVERNLMKNLKNGFELFVFRCGREDKCFNTYSTRDDTC